MFSRRIAEVQTVKRISAHCEELFVSIDGECQRALNYIPLTGHADVGERVVLNTTAVELGLGSGGQHFVYLNLEKIEQRLTGDGHLIKLRYTPAQMRILALEEDASPYHRQMREATSLAGMVVITAELHSMLTPVALTIKKEKPAARVVYLMTDGGALPAYYSHSARLLRERGLLEAVISSGHAFGGDLEAVNVFSGLLAARHVLKADIAVVCMGPGVAGTATPFGFSGIEMGENINRIHALGGRAVALPRISFSDRRKRHHGLSHHTVTALGKVALVPSDLPLPVLPDAEQDVLSEQLKSAELDKKHRVYWHDGLSLDHLEQSGIKCSTMGRTPDQDEAFFMAAAAAARHAVGLLELVKP